MAVDQTETQKPVITENSPIDVVFYKGRIFLVPFEMIQYLSQQPDNLRERIRLAGEMGLGGMTQEGGFGCWYCDHYQNNIAHFAKSGKGGECRVMNTKGTPGISVEGCLYKGNDDVKWATTFVSRENGFPILAQMTPCVAYDAKIEALAQRGLLDQYEVKGKGLNFNYPTINELEGKPAHVSIASVEPSAPVKKDETGKGLLGRIRKYMRGIFGNTY